MIIGAGIAATPIEQAAVVITGPNVARVTPKAGRLLRHAHPYQGLLRRRVRRAGRRRASGKRIGSPRRTFRGERIGRLLHVRPHREPRRTVQDRRFVRLAENARANLAAENAGWDFAAVRHAAERR